ncbi:glycine cleavage system aminomethyltransferase GcvT, partial [Oligoflexia bacterium]|nr:glycine cleavage system aminomethyltransferase GcvT [Oligoflexia bacterium]
HELGEDISALESQLGWIVKLKKGDFVGRSVLEQQKQAGPPRTLVGFFVEGRGIVRHGDKIVSEGGDEIGYATSGTKTPTVNKALGLALVKAEYQKVGTQLIAEVRGRKLACRVVEVPFYKRGQ